MEIAAPAQPHRRALPSADLVLALGLALASAAYISWVLFRWGGDDLQLALADGLFLPLGLVVTALALRTARHSPDRGSHRAWMTMAAAFAAYALGDITWFLIEVVQGLEVPTPSLADLFYLSFYPLLVAGLLTLPRVGRGHSLTFVIDLGIVLVASGAAIWWLVLGPIVAASGSDATATLVALAYPVGDTIALFALTATLLVRLKQTSRVALLILGAGLLLNIAADLAYARMVLEESWEGGTWLDVCYASGWILMGTACIVQWRVSQQGGSLALTDEAPALPALPYVAIAVIYGLLAITSMDAAADERVLVVGAVVVSVLVLTRLALTNRERSALLAGQATRRNDARHRAILQQASDVVVVTDPQGTVSFVTPSIEAVLQRDPAEVGGSPLTSMLQADDAPLVVELLRTAAGRSGTHGPVRCRSLAEPVRQLELSVSNQLDNDLVAGLVVTIRDVTERQSFEDQLRSKALHDPLTGLANRALFSDRVDQALHRARRRRVTPAVLYIDVDDFKSINDTLGHQAGDDVIVELAQRLRTCLRQEDTAARLGGDEFGILIEDSRDAADAVAVAARVYDALARPFEIDGRSQPLGVSIGIARSRGRQTDSSALLRDADIAMYEAKREARGSYRVFEPEMYAATVERVRLQSDIRSALDEGQLEVVYQPLVRLDDGLLVGTEALLRWHHPTRGLVMPATFIPIAESCGEIGRIGLWVLEQACRTVRGLERRAGDLPLRASVNVSIRQLEPSFPDAVSDVLGRTGLAPEQLVLEVTESVFAAERPTLVEILARLRAMGVRIAIDDFGTGYSALSYLRDLPVDELKVDRAFIEKLGDRSDHGLVSTILQMGRDLSLDTVAEGIESETQAELLRALGCAVGQGFLLGRPVRQDLLPGHRDGDTTELDVPRVA